MSDSIFSRAADAMDAAATPETPQPIQVARVWDALGTVIDPEIGLDIVTLGLVYDLAITDGQVEVTHTLTTPGCPMEEVIAAGIHTAVGRVPGVTGVSSHVVWEPRWHPGMIQEVEW